MNKSTEQRLADTAFRSASGNIKSAFRSYGYALTSIGKVKGAVASESWYDTMIEKLEAFKQHLENDRNRFYGKSADVLPFKPTKAKDAVRELAESVNIG